MSYLPTDPNANTQGPTGTTTNVPGQPAGGPGSTAPPPAQSGGSVGGGTAAAPAGASNGSPQQFGSSASKLGDYLTANAPQIGQQANTVSQGLNAGYNQVSNDIGSAANTQLGAINAGYTPGNQALVNQAAADPTGFTSGPQGAANIAGFQGQLNDTYTGPTAFEGTTPYSNIQNEVNTASQNAGLLNTPSGLQNYLGSTTSGVYTPGEQTLDQLMISGNPAAQAQVQQAAGQYSQLTPQLSSDTASLDALVPLAQQAALGANQYANNTLNPVASQFNTGLNTGVTNANAADTAYNNALNADVTATQPMQQQALTLAGLSGQNLSSVVNPYNPTSEITTPSTLANTSTAQQYAEANALQQLLGQGYSSPLDQANVAQAGTNPIVPTLSNLTPANMAQEDVNALLGGTAPNPAAGYPAQDLSQPGSANYNLLQYLQSQDPASVSTLPSTNPYFSGWDVGNYAAVPQ